MYDDVWIGLDVGADEVQVCAIDQQGNVLNEGLVPNSADNVADFVAACAPDKRFIFALEACSYSFRLTRGLRAKGHHVSVLEARQASRFLKIQQNKTDANDARGLANICRFGGGVISEVYVKSTHCQDIRSQLVIRQNLVAQRVALENVLRSVLRTNGGKAKRWRSANVLRAHVDGEVSRLRHEGTKLPDDLEALVVLCEAMWRYIDNSSRRLTNVAQSIEVCRRWMEIPGIGPITALAFYSTIEEPQRFVKAQDIGPYLGLVPTIRQSGSVRVSRGISKRGNTMTRTLLATAAMTLMKPGTADSDLKSWAIVLKERVGHRRAKMALARKIAIVMLAMWKTGEPFQPFNSRQETEAAS